MYARNKSGPSTLPALINMDLARNNPYSTYRLNTEAKVSTQFRILEKPHSYYSWRLRGFLRSVDTVAELSNLFKVYIVWTKIVVI